MEFQLDGTRAIIDVRERVLRGEHPRKEILDFVKSTPVGTVIEVHLPHRGEPLAAGFTALGMNAIINELEPGHYRLMAVKLEDRR